MRYIWYNNPNHKHGNYGSYKDAIKIDIITFIEGKITNALINEHLKNNFKRNGMKKLIEDRFE